MNDLPKDYVWLPMPPHEQYKWEGVVHSRARIQNPDFHGGKTEAIRMIVGHEEKPITVPAFGLFPARRFYRREPVAGEWLEFRNFKEVNAFVQAWKRLGK